VILHGLLKKFMQAYKVSSNCTRTALSCTRALEWRFAKGTGNAFVRTRGRYAGTCLLFQKPIRARMVFSPCPIAITCLPDAMYSGFEVVRRNVQASLFLQLGSTGKAASLV
jgi:hypothetical protein